MLSGVFENLRCRTKNPLVLTSCHLSVVYARVILPLLLVSKLTVDTRLAAIRLVLTQCLSCKSKCFIEELSQIWFKTCLKLCVCSRKDFLFDNILLLYRGTELCEGDIFQHTSFVHMRQVSDLYQTKLNKKVNG